MAEEIKTDMGAAQVFCPQPDEPSLDLESLPSRKELLHRLVQSVLHCSPPQVFGIHGDWGSGKTSFLQNLQYELSGECPQNPAAEEMFKKAKPEQTKRWSEYVADVIWFEAWRYQNESVPVVALLHEMRAQLTWKKNFLAKLIDSAGKGTETTFRTALLALEDMTCKIECQAGIPGLVGAKSELSGQGPKFRQAYADTQAARLATTLPANHIRQALDDILKKLLNGDSKSTSRRLIIIIDDLDRCEPEAAFRLLEGIKIYLNLQSCVFVLGLNVREVQRAITRVLSDKAPDVEILTRAQEYIEKLCGNIVRLPIPSNKEQADLLKSWFEKTPDVPGCNALIKLLNQHPFLPANPRRIKAFSNTVRRFLHSCSARPETVTEDQQVRALAIIASLYQFHPELYSALEKSPVDFARNLKTFCRKAFPNPAEERKTGEAFETPLLRKYVRPWSVVEQAVSASAPPLDPEKTATPAGPGAELRESKLVFTPLFADATALDVLHCQTLIAETEVNPDAIRLFLGH